jgi:phage baseplate assembly protein W
MTGVGNGMDWNTGRIISGWDHVLQSITIVLTTGYGERVMRRWFGSHIPHLLGENLTTPTVMRFFAALIAALEVREADTGLPREPRFKITKITPLKVERTGELRIDIVGYYMPRGHLGDFTPADIRTLSFARGSDGLLTTVA